MEGDIKHILLHIKSYFIWSYPGKSFSVNYEIFNLVFVNNLLDFDVNFSLISMLCIHFSNKLDKLFYVSVFGQIENQICCKFDLLKTFS